MEKERTNIKSSLKRKAEDDMGKKQTIGQCFQRNSAGWHVDSVEHKERVNSIVDVLIETCNPVTHVDKPSFRRMWKVADPKFNLPGILINFHCLNFNKSRAESLTAVALATIGLIGTFGISRNARIDILGQMLDSLGRMFRSVGPVKGWVLRKFVKMIWLAPLSSYSGLIECG